MIALISLFIVSALLYSRSKYCTDKFFLFLKPAGKKITSRQLNVSYLLILFCLYSIQMGWVMALFLMLFTLSICLPISVLIAHHHRLLLMFIVLFLAALGGIF